MDSVPQVYHSNNPLPPVSVWKKRLPILLVAALIIIVLLEAGWFLNTFFTQKQTTQKQAEAEISNLSTPQLVATTAKKSFSIGEEVPITIKVVTGGNPTDSVDILVKYDPTLLEASGPNFVEIGRIYPEYPVANFDNTRGVVQVSGTNLSGEQSFSGIGTFATLNFKAKKAGPATIALDFQANSTSDSNLVLAGTAKDILAQVTNTDIMITESGNIDTTGQTAASCTGYYQYCQVGEKTGKQFCQKGAMKEGICSFDPVLTVSCSECEIK